MNISIHAPREGSDGQQCYGGGIADNFNPRSPRGERPYDPDLAQKRVQISIHAPREGSDMLMGMAMVATIHFNPRSPRGERRCGSRAGRSAPGISIHAPREGSDLFGQIGLGIVHISIHAPREGSDGVHALAGVSPVDFNPRSPRGERLDVCA